MTNTGFANIIFVLIFIARQQTAPKRSGLSNDDVPFFWFYMSWTHQHGSDLLHSRAPSFCAWLTETTGYPGISMVTQGSRNKCSKERSHVQLFVKTACNTQLLLAFGFFCRRGLCCLVVAKDPKQGQYKKEKQAEFTEK